MTDNLFFYINGQTVRRRDVINLFRGTGVSPKAYGVVEQGMVSRIAEASPEELRAFVEEAAGSFALQRYSLGIRKASED